MFLQIKFSLFFFVQIPDLMGYNRSSFFWYSIKCSRDKWAACLLHSIYCE